MYGVEANGLQGKYVGLLVIVEEVSKGRRYIFLSEMKALPKVVCSTQIMQRCPP
jgi:hypothetical protein